MKNLKKIGLLMMIVATFGSAALAETMKSKDKKIPYTVAKRYFVSNTVENGSFVFPKITTQEGFDKLFGMAAVMGKDGTPTPIDFSKQFVIAVIDPVTGNSVELTAKSLTKKDNTLTFTYSRKEQVVSNSSAAFRHLLLVVVDKKYEGNVLIRDADQRESIPFVLGKNYFVSNQVPQGEHVYPKITTSEEYEKLFGMATLMGEGGQPTGIDFSKQYVIAVIKPSSNYHTPVSVESLLRKDGTITLTYSKLGAEKESTAAYRYYLIVIVDKSYEGEVKIVQKN